MGTLWVLNANSSFAKIFEVKGLGREIRELQHIDNPEGRMKSGEILQDRPGRTFDRMGPGRHALGKEIDVRTEEQKIFAKKLAELLKSAKDDHAFDELALVAPPQFLGEINLALADSVKKMISKEINKDLPIHLSDKDRIEYLCNCLNLWNHEG